MRAAVIQFPGSNCDRDMAVALETVTGRAPAMVWHRETELPDVGLVRVRNAESDRIMWVDSSDMKVRREYNNWYGRQQVFLNDTFLRSGVDVARIRTDQDYVKALLNLFAKRN